MQPVLPVDNVIADLIESLNQEKSLVLRAPTGAGKTTRVPPALLPVFPNRQILVVEPRRVAARAAARRMAQEHGSRCGDVIGYHVRFDRCAGPETRLLVVTPGILLQRMHHDPFLENVQVVIFDEFHERGLESDLGLGLVRLLQQTVRPDVRIIAMSATLASEEVARYLGACPVVVSEGRQFPVTIRHEAKPATMNWPDAAAAAARRLIQQTPGDILVFLPGWAEIRQTARALEQLAVELGLDVMPLHGDLSPAEQDRALMKSGRRKVVLATNVAETSVTVEGITGIVDTGLVRELSFDPGIGLDRLRVVPISQASADQRAGRAGRTQPGICLRLWNEGNHRARPAFTVPEIRRVDLAGALLHLLALGEQKIESFPWPEAPPKESIDRANQELRLLGAMNDTGITELGRVLARIPVHPRLARMLWEGARLGHSRPTALAAALLAERDPFRRLTTRERPPSISDILDRAEVLEKFARDGQFDTVLGELDGAAARFILRASDQLERTVREVQMTSNPTATAEEAVLRALTAAFPDRVCRRRNPGGRKGVMVGGRGVRLDNRSSVTRSPLFLAIDLEAGREDSEVRIASLVERDWLNPNLVTTSLDTELDEATGRVSAWKRTRYLDLLLEETPTAVPEDVDADRLLLRTAQANAALYFPPSDSPAAAFRLRVRCLRIWRPELELPIFDEPQMTELLTWLVPSCRSLKDLPHADWLGVMRGQLTANQLRAVDSEAPERLDTPSGRSIALTYEEGRPPILAARIQELFGWVETPKIAGGRVAVLLHLLAPNNRPQQVTDDLASFWKNTYPVVRKELRVRYPKHAWPEDPLRVSVEAQPNSKKPRP
jgi:ATP-dependent helicase HrpB